MVETLILRQENYKALPAHQTRNILFGCLPAEIVDKLSKTKSEKFDFFL